LIAVDGLALPLSMTAPAASANGSMIRSDLKFKARPNKRPENIICTHLKSDLSQLSTNKSAETTKQLDAGL
jgi:hypothetical protein